MRVLIYTDGLAQEWSEMILVQGHEAAVLPAGASVPQMPADVCLVAMSDPVAERFWMADVPAPILLITSAVGPARVLCGRIPSLRLICHPSRAVRALDDMLQMTCDVQAGVAIFGRHIQPLRSERRWGGRYANN